MSCAIPVIMRPGDIISIKEAAFRTGKNEKTIRRWCVNDGIGRRSSRGANWEISVLALEAKLYGDADALADLRSGRFDTWAVRRYADQLGIS